MRKRLTQIFPFLIPIRKWQRECFYFLKMKFDKNTYANVIDNELLPYKICEVKCPLINEFSGYDIKYQYNKVDNIKITAQTMNNLLIFPNEVFSFCNLQRKHKKYGKYKKGLVLVNDKIIPMKGGGICGLSNLLYYAFLLTPLKVIERHAHHVKSLPNASENDLEGIDATINSGWLDLKVKNDTNYTYQINITFNNKDMIIKIFSNHDSFIEARIINENLKYIKKNNKVYEKLDVVKELRNKNNNKVLLRKKLYEEEKEVTYKVKEDIIDEEL